MGIAPNFHFIPLKTVTAHINGRKHRTTMLQMKQLKQEKTPENRAQLKRKHSPESGNLECGEEKQMTKKGLMNRKLQIFFSYLKGLILILLILITMRILRSASQLHGEQIFKNWTVRRAQTSTLSKVFQKDFLITTEWIIIE